MPQTLPFPDLADRWRCVEAFTGGEGWSGRVVEHHGGPARLLKVLDAGHEVGEASLLASLRHPKIPAILEVGRTADGRAFLLREFREGVPLTQRIPLAPDAVAELAVQLLELLAFVHLRGILHLDLKPANVLDAGQPQEPSYHLLDFGLGSRNARDAHGGTPYFASPEVLLGLPADPRSDLFSLGALLLVALRGDPGLAALRQFLTRFPKEGFLAVQGLDSSDLPAPFHDLLPRLIARRPGKRFADAQEALEALGSGTGRPTVSLLQPDPIALFGPSLIQPLDQLRPGQGLEIRGGASADRNALAVHAACQLGDVRQIHSGPEACILTRGSADRAVVILPLVETEPLAQHLAAATNLPRDRALAAAQHLRASGATSAASIGQQLQALAEAGRILPDGTRWVWPDALAGRLDTPLVPIAAEPEALREAAARGQIEGALASYRRAVSDCSAAQENALRAALAEGCLLAGEPHRALPLTYDLPLLRGRALLDCGQVRAARLTLTSAGQAGQQLDGSGLAMARLWALLALAEGDLDRAERDSRAVAASTQAPEDRIVLGWIMGARGQDDEAIATLRDASADPRVEARPFLRAAALTNLADAERRSGDLAAARVHHQQALQLYQALGNVRHTATGSANLGVVAKDSGDFAGAFEWLRRARALFAHVKDHSGEALVEANLGIVSLEAGDPVSGLRRLIAAQHRLQELGARQALPLVKVMRARAHALVGERPQAASLLAELGQPLHGRIAAEAVRVAALLAEPDRLTSVKTEKVNTQPGIQDQVDEQSRSLPTMAYPSESTGIPREVFRTFLAVNRRLAREADLERAMTFLLDNAITITGGSHGYLLIVRPSGVRMEIRAGDPGEEAIAFSRSLVHRAVQQRRTLTADDALADRELLEMPSVRGLTRRSVVCVPFRSASGTEGALYVEQHDRAGAFGEREKEHLEILADQAAIAVERLLHEEQIVLELQRSRRQLEVVRRTSKSNKTPTLLGKSRRMDELRRQIERVAGSELPVLILGETGSGKELVARAVHTQSARHSGPFVAENCSALSPELMESELFGHEQGAFTGADQERVGLLELASGGTLFLDEIGDMPPALQVKLLRALQEQSIRRVGGNTTIPLDLRVLAATHKDPRKLIAAGAFREDLYFRIAAVELQIPPLRDRGEDIGLLAAEFLARLNLRYGRDVTLPDAARQRLLAYRWPGNVRELEHVISRAFLLTEDNTLKPEHLPEPGAERLQVDAAIAAAGKWPVMTLQESEDRTIRAALEHTGGDKTKAAKTLGISRTALYEKLKRMNAPSS